MDEFLPTLAYVDRVVDEWTVVRRIKRQSFSILYLKTDRFTLSVPPYISESSELDRRDDNYKGESNL